MTAAGNFAAAVFDLDGTLVDTLGLHFEAYRDVFSRRGWELSRERFMRVVGGTAAETIPRMIDRSLSADEVAEVHRDKKARIEELFARAPIPLLGSSLLLRLLPDHLPTALVTSGSERGVRQLLERVGWDSRFDVIVCGGDVSRGKPDPESFLLAATRLSVPPAQCLAFEDTTPGVAAAEAAGMTVIDVRKSLNSTVGYVRG